MTESSTIPVREDVPPGREDHLREPAGEPDRRRDREPPRADRRRAGCRTRTFRSSCSTSGTPDFFFNHFDLTAAAEFPVPEDADDAAGVDGPGGQAFPGSVHHYRFDPRPHPGGGNELALAFDLRYASRENAVFGQPEVGSGLLPGGGGTERLPRVPWQGPGAGSHSHQRRLRRRHGREGGDG